MMIVVPENIIYVLLSSLPNFYGVMIDPHNDLIPVGLRGQLVEHCTGIAEVRVGILIRAFLSAA